jgi:NADPH:quinone reductase-like Zn-dependent oxidoreductase
VTNVAGVVVDVGPGVNGFQAGDEVVAMLNSFVSTLHSWLF